MMWHRNIHQQGMLGAATVGRQTRAHSPPERGCVAVVVEPDDAPPARGISFGSLATSSFCILV
jgi:hypothetical protein